MNDRAGIRRAVVRTALACSWCLALSAGVARADPEAAEAGAARAVADERPTVRRGYPVGRSLSPITPEVAARLREIAAARPRRDDVLVKVGDSMSQSRAFLQCFAWGRMDLDGRDELSATVEHFLHGDAGGEDPFSRDSEATAVGWRAHSILRGSPSALDRELRQTRPRFATLMLGTNDMQSGRPWVFARRLWRIVDRLVDGGTIPVMSSILPRADRAHRDRDVPLYSLIARGIAQHERLPFLDYRREMERLPRRGLAGDGLHANVLVVNGRPRPCDFTEEGLRHGHNVRNLLHLRMLHRLRAVVLDGAPAPDPSWPAAVGDGSAEAPFELAALPATRVRELPEAGHRHRITLPARGRVHLRAFSRTGPSLRLRLVPAGGEPVEGPARHGIVATLPAGEHVVEVRPSSEEQVGAPYLLIADRLLPPAIDDNPYM